MHKSYQSCDEEARDSYDYYHNGYRSNNWDHLNNCRCQYGTEISYPNSSTSDYHSSCCSSYCGWEGCQNSYSDHYEHSDQLLGAYNIRANRRDLNVLNSGGNENNVKYLSSRNRWYPTRRRRQSRYTSSAYNNGGYCTCNSGVTSEISSTTTPEMIEHPRGGHVGFNIPECSIIDDRSNNNTSTSLGKDSFHSCLACNSCQIETVYENKGHMSSKSTINHGSNQTLDEQASGGTCRTPLRERQRRKVNSGYYEFVSPTRIQTRSTPHTRASNSSKKETNTIGTDILKRPLHYGYFEVKERGYSSNEYNRERTSFPELDKIPTKMSKQIDTTHFKESTMIDKSLSAHLGYASGVKTSNKSLLANISVKNRKLLTQSDIAKIVNKLMQRKALEVKRSSKIRQVQSHSSKSLTNFKISASSKQSMAKVNRSIHDAKKVVKTVKSLSEGSVHVRKESSKHSTRKSQDGATSYKNYLDAALDKLETQITKKLRTVLTSYRDTPTKKPLVTLYHNDTNNTTKMLFPNTKSVHCKSNFGTNPSPTMITPEDIIDSEEVEIGSSDFEGRSSLSQICLPARNNCNYNSDISSYNTEGSNFTRGSVERYKKINRQHSSSHGNHATQKDEVENACEIALVRQAILPEQNQNGYSRKSNEDFETCEKSDTSFDKQLKKNGNAIETTSFSSDFPHGPNMLNRPSKHSPTTCSETIHSTTFSTRKHGTSDAQSHAQSSCSSPCSETIYSSSPTIKKCGTSDIQCHSAAISEHHNPHHALPRESSDLRCSENSSVHQYKVLNTYPDKPCSPVNSCAEDTFSTAHESHAREEDTFHTALHPDVLEPHSSPMGCNEYEHSTRTSRNRLPPEETQIQGGLVHQKHIFTVRGASRPQHVTRTSKQYVSQAASRTASKESARAGHHKPSRLVQKTTSAKCPQSCPLGKLEQASTTTPASRDPCDRCNRFQHHKSSLCTIEEENEYLSDPSLKVLHESNSNSMECLTEQCRDASASLTKTQGHFNCQPPTKPVLSVSKYEITDSSYEDILGHCDASKRNIYKADNDDPCKCQHQHQCHLQPQYQPKPQLQHYDDFRFKNSMYLDCCMKQTCGDCPKKRYYSQILPPYRENLHRHHHNEKHSNKLYSYMLDVPPYTRNREHGNKFLNVVSFVVFLIIFYGIFQYIDLGVGTGKFP